MVRCFPGHIASFEIEHFNKDWRKADYNMVDLDYLYRFLIGLKELYLVQSHAFRCLQGTVTIYSSLNVESSLHSRVNSHKTFFW